MTLATEPIGDITEPAETEAPTLEELETQRTRAFWDLHQATERLESLQRQRDQYIAMAEAQFDADAAVPMAAIDTATDAIETIHARMVNQDKNIPKTATGIGGQTVKTTTYKGDGSVSVKVADKALLLKWCEENAPELVETPTPVATVKASAIKAAGWHLVTDSDTPFYVHPDGAEVLGLEISVTKQKTELK